MVGKIFITRSGYDPEKGKHVKDPYLGPNPTMGACRPDIRKQLKIGDHIFAISGKLKGSNQFVMGGFSIVEKIPVQEAYERFPEQKLHTLEDGQLAGNIIVDRSGRQLNIDTHKPETIDQRVKNYVVGGDPICLETPKEIMLGRNETLDALREILKRKGGSPFEVVGRYGTLLTEEQVEGLRTWLESIKKRAIA
ncbi:MAG TPA: hypothetical protein VGN72_01020 [Tepidisphaeraceae bacterium]|jgi:hypothetical protein|nr:hypothetical protein [Tepidisphaeraceae bacterium]